MDKTNFVPVSDLPCITTVASAGLVEMAERAAQFLTQYGWCQAIDAGYLDRAVPGVIAIFYFEIVPASSVADSAVWVIVGDVPPAYMDVQSCPSGIDALEAYLFCMEEWIEAVNTGASVDELMPIYYGNGVDIMETTVENASVLASRVATVRSDIVPWLRDWSPSDKQ